MEIPYQLTQRDFYDSIIAHRNRNVFSKWLYRLNKALALAGLALVIIFGVSVIPYAEWPSSYVPLFLLCIFIACLLWISPRLIAGSQFSKQPAVQGPRTVLIDSVGAHWRFNGGSSEHEWKNFVRVLETKTHFLFYSSPASFNPVPKRALTPEQMAEFRALLLQHGVLFKRTAKE
jgi:hypothetical protein